MEKKVVIITGASSGIGKALAIEYAQHGYNVVMAARSTDKLTELAQHLSEHTGVLSVTTDVTKEADCQHLIEETVAKFGRIDILINNAGISMRAIFLEMELEVMRQVMDVNFWGTVYCTKYALPELLKTHGSVVGISSVAGMHSLPARSGYSASKYAMQGFLDTIRIEHRHQLHVLVFAPGFTASNVRVAALTADGTPQGHTPRKEENMMSAEQVAKRIRLAIKRKRRFIAITFAGHATNLVKKFWPALLDWSFYRAMKKEPDSPLK
jgi:short-subunit dehydrogenase